jgi:RNA recognition motif-containing protein
MPVYFDKEKTKQTIALVLDNIRTEADPLLLAEYNSLFKKEISVFHRSKAAAYLLMLCDQRKELRKKLRLPPRQPALQGDVARKAENNSRFTPVTAKKDEHSRIDAQRCLLTDEESKRLFFSAGRSRRVFAREIIGLITTKASVSREDIGAIRVLDNYSFVQIRDTVAEKTIEALNGLKFRGRPLTVNYAKSHKDEETSEQEQDYSEEENI